MKIRTLAFSAQALALGALLATPALCVAADTPGGKATAKDVSRKADETSRAIKGYTVAQRDEAVTQAKAALDDVDARIRRMERKLDGEWDKMDGAARKKSRAARSALRRERAEHERHQRQRHPASLDAEDEQDAADDFRRHRQIRNLSREAERFEILGGA